MRDKAKLVDMINQIKRFESQSGTAEEAQNALAHAQRLMISYNISEQELAQARIPTIQDVKTSVVSKTINSVHWLGSLAAIIAKNFRCTSYTEGEHCKMMNPSGSMYWEKYSLIKLMGIDEDVEIACAVFRAAQAAIEMHSDAHVYSYYQRTHAKRTIPVTRQVRTDYIFGFLLGLQQKLAAQVNALSQSQALVIVQPEAVKQATKALALRNAPKRATKVGYSDSYAKGHKDGKSWDSNQILAPNYN